MLVNKHKAQSDPGRIKTVFETDARFHGVTVRLHQQPIHPDVSLSLSLLKRFIMRWRLKRLLYDGDPVIIVSDGNTGNNAELYMHEMTQSLLTSQKERSPCGADAFQIE